MNMPAAMPVMWIDIGRSPAADRADQMFGNRCHALQRMPTMNPVETMPRVRLSAGIAKPVHPSSSKMPAATPTARLVSRSDSGSSEVTMPGRKPRETEESAASAAAIAAGAISRAAYQRAPARQAIRRDAKAARPLRPCSSAVMKRPDRAGPASIANNA